jgi:hypothetical protein
MASNMGSTSLLKKMGSRDKLHEDMNGWPSTGWNGKPRAKDSILIIRATTINKSETRNNTVYTVTESSLTFWILLRKRNYFRVIFPTGHGYAPSG